MHQSISKDLCGLKRFTSSSRHFRIRASHLICQKQVAYLRVGTCRRRLQRLPASEQTSERARTSAVRPGGHRALRCKRRRKTARARAQARAYAADGNEPLFGALHSRRSLASPPPPPPPPPPPSPPTATRTATLRTRARLFQVARVCDVAAARQRLWPKIT